ncbi:MAG: hypothetical protein KAT90_03830 [Gammaproteobacteria bacterium]|nr:hypothetical protein [Gammaproteobacteria bacterium]
MKTLKVLSAVVLVGSAIIASNSAFAQRDTGRGTGPVIYVTSQGQFFDSIVLTDLPQQGDFQQLIPTENGLTTEFGPGDVGHLGGRWWIDVNGDSMMDAGDKYFLCPLLGPGRDTF